MNARARVAALGAELIREVRRPPRPPRRIETRVYYIARGLTGREAIRRAHRLDQRAGWGDHRGATYNPRTGRVTLT